MFRAIQHDDGLTSRPELERPLSTSGTRQISQHGDAVLIGFLGAITAFGYYYCPQITSAALLVFGSLQAYKKVFPKLKPLPDLSLIEANSVTFEGLWTGEGKTWVEHETFPSLGRPQQYSVKVRVDETYEGRIATITANFKQSGITAVWRTGFEAKYKESETGATIVDLDVESHEYPGNVHGYGIIQLSDILQKGDHAVGRFFVQGISDNFGLSFRASDVCTLKKQEPNEEDQEVNTQNVSHRNIRKPRKPRTPTFPLTIPKPRSGTPPSRFFSSTPASVYKKCAAVLSVFKQRDHLKAAKEASDLEDKLKGAGYDIWRCEESRNSKNNLPISTTRAHLEEFNEYFVEHKEKNDLDGVFIMIIAHGCTDMQDDKPLLQLEDEDGANFDLLNWLVEVISGTAFPTICCVNSCRVVCGLQSNQEPKFNNFLDVPHNIFLMLASAHGDKARDGDLSFVDTWRKSIAADFDTKDITVLAEEVRRTCKAGRVYNGLDPGKAPCVNGIWASNEHLPSKIYEKSEKALLLKCVNWSIKSANKSGFDFTQKVWYTILSDILNSDDSSRFQKLGIEGMPQGKFILVTEEEMFAVMCYNPKSNLIHGMLYLEEGKDSLEKLFQSVNSRELTDAKTILYHSQKEFLDATKHTSSEKKRKPSNRMRRGIITSVTSPRRILSNATAEVFGTTE